MRVIKTDDYLSVVLGNRNRELAEHLKADVIAIRSPIVFGLDQVVRHEVESLHSRKGDSPRPRKLAVILETNGGHIEVVERIYNVFRKHYRTVLFIVPNYAYSAGTVLVLSGDEIYMDYYSVLGPIDPQYESEDGRFVPGLGYLQKFEELMAVVNKAEDPSSVRAELAYLLNKFDPATLFWLEQARNHSISLLEEWLPRHKFRSWIVTKTRREKVTPAMRRERARAIARVLGDATRWHSHGRGIGIKELTSDEIKLDVLNFGDDPRLSSRIGNYYHLFIDYCSKIGSRGTEDTVIHSTNGMRTF